MFGDDADENHDGEPLLGDDIDENHYDGEPLEVGLILLSSSRRADDEDAEMAARLQRIFFGPRLSVFGSFYKNSS